MLLGIPTWTLCIIGGLCVSDIFEDCLGWGFSKFCIKLEDSGPVILNNLFLVLLQLVCTIFINMNYDLLMQIIKGHEIIYSLFPIKSRVFRKASN